MFVGAQEGDGEFYWNEFNQATVSWDRLGGRNDDSLPGSDDQSSFSGFRLLDPRGLGFGVGFGESKSCVICRTRDESL